MFTFLIATAGILITIFLIVGIHEFGHFIVAKWCDIKVLKFSIGFGKNIVSCRDRSGTEYALALLPLGGYVKMLDESDDEVAPNADLSRAYNRQPFYKKFAVIAAGPLFNFLFAFLLYWFLFSVGFESIAPVAGTIMPGSIAQHAGLKSGDEIVQIDQQPTTKWISVVIALISRAGDMDALTIVARGKDKLEHQYQLDIKHWQLNPLNPDPLTSLGIVPQFNVTPNIIRYNHYSILGAVIPAWDDVKLFTHINFIMLGKMLTGKISLQSLGGPISIFQNAGAALNSGLKGFLGFLAFLSISIGVINILPVPGLDGGHLLLQSVEKVQGKTMSDRTQLLISRLGLAFLFVIMVQAVMNDVLRLAT